jgi:hypothetical protein
MLTRPPRGARIKADTVDTKRVKAFIVKSAGSWTVYTGPEVGTGGSDYSRSTGQLNETKIKIVTFSEKGGSEPVWRLQSVLLKQLEMLVADRGRKREKRRGYKGLHQYSID